MQLTERLKSDLILTNHCINKVKWTPQGDQQAYDQQFKKCIFYVAKAEVVFRGHVFSPRAGEPTYYNGPQQ